MRISSASDGLHQYFPRIAIKVLFRRESVVLQKVLSEKRNRCTKKTLVVNVIMNRAKIIGSKPGVRGEGLGQCFSTGVPWNLSRCAAKS